MYTYKGGLAFDVKDYLSCYRGGWVNLFYSGDMGQKLISQLPKMIDTSSKTDMYAYAVALYKHGNRMEKDKAYSILSDLASKNYIPAYREIGKIYFDGICVTKNYNTAFKWFDKAAREAYMVAYNDLAICYFEGLGCTKNYDKGRQLLEEAANEGYGMAIYNIGIGYFRGIYGYPKDAYMAFDYFKRASSQFNNLAEYNLGVMYLTGTGCSKNIDMAIKYFRDASGTGHNKAANKLGDIYYYGVGIPKDTGKAYAFYSMAAENGDSYGMYSVAYMILNGEIYWVDKSVGKQWLKKAADLGNESAFNLLKKIR